jgi:hypothetical protein
MGSQARDDSSLAATQEGYGAAMTERLFLFVQMEFPWELGPPDGRYLLRARQGAEAERVVVLGTLSAQRRAPARGVLAGGGRRARARGRTAAPEPEPAPVATARATIVDPVSLSAERQAQAWLSDLDGEREIGAAVEVLNRVLHFHRIAAANPYVHEVSPDQALVIRAGWGEGEQVADGLWMHAQELTWRGRGGVRKKRIGDRAAALRPQERLAELLGARGAALLCEELVLRARLDLDQGRIAHAAIELQAAYATALKELRGERREDLAIRIAELEKLQDGVVAQAHVALGVELGSVADAGADADAGTASSEHEEGAPDEEVVRHGLERLEAALRARTAAGFRLK